MEERRHTQHPELLQSWNLGFRVRIEGALTLCRCRKCVCVVLVRHFPGPTVLGTHLLGLLHFPPHSLATSHAASSSENESGLPLAASTCSSRFLLTYSSGLEQAFKLRGFSENFDDLFLLNCPAELPATTRKNRKFKPLPNPDS